MIISNTRCYSASVSSARQYLCLNILPARLGENTVPGSLMVAPTTPAVRWSTCRRREGVTASAVKRSIGSTTGCTITEKAPTRAFSWLKAPTSAFTFKTLLRHYAKQALTPRSLNVKCESASRRSQPGEGPSRGLLRDCTTGCGTDGALHSTSPQSTVLQWRAST